MKRIAVFTLVLALAAANLVMPGIAAGADETAITTAEELASVSGSGNYVLMNDILITGTWNSPEEFSGTLNGNGHTVVFSGAVVTGGLFGKLSGATIKNLNITEGSEANVFYPAETQADFPKYYFGTLAYYANGTIENVTTDVDADIWGYYNSYSGGIVGAIWSGDLTLKNCVNTGDVASGTYAGGLVGGGTSSATSATLTVEQCANYGAVSAPNNAGGMVGGLNADCLNLTIRNCVNFGEIVHRSGDQGGGIIGWLKPAAVEGTANVTCNINFGMIYNLGIKSGKSVGIVGAVNTNGGAEVNVTGNINYAALAPVDGQTTGTVAAIVFSDVTKAENNYTVEISKIGAKDKNALALDENTLAALQELYPDTFVSAADGSITLVWMESLGLDATAPVVGYNVAGQNRVSVPVGTPIATAEELAAIKKDGVYYLADDIVITGEWTSPVGFAGTLNGNGHSIVLDGATVTGGVFNQLDGALIRNLSITEGEKANTLAAKSNLFGVLADTAWGVYENIVVDVELDFSTNTASKVGGLIGQRANAGGLYLSDCVNHGSIKAGEAAGGMVAEISGSYNGWINRCINNGDLTAVKNCGGMVGTSAETWGFTIQYCINNGDLSHTGENCGGMLGYMKFTKNQGGFRFLHNINYGTITNTKTKGSEAGIAGYLNTQDSTIIMAGNINYTVPAGGANGSAIWTTGTSARQEIYDNFAADLTKYGTQTAPQDSHKLLADDTLAYLNAAYPGVYAPAADGKITLAWTVMNTLPGASIRMDSPTGLRFATEFDAAFLAALAEQYGEENMTIGTLIAPEAFVKEAGSFTKEALDALEKQSAAYLVVVAGQPYQQSGDSMTYVGSVANIMEKHYELNYAAIGYVTVDGQTYYAPSYTVRSVCEIAAAALADLSETQNDEYAYEVTVGDKIFYSPYTEAQRAILQAFVA